MIPLSHMLPSLPIFSKRAHASSNPLYAIKEMAISDKIKDPQESQYAPSTINPVPTFGVVGSLQKQALAVTELDRQVAEALEAWLVKSPSLNTRENYSRDLSQFLDFVGIPAEHLAKLTVVRPQQVAAWRDALRALGLTNSSGR